jgi:hypothetical protein
MKKLIFIALFTGVLGVLSLGIHAQDQPKAEGEKIISVAKEILPSKGENPNITKDRPSQDTPTVSRGKKPCMIAITNETPYVIDIYLDSEYIGTMGANTKDFTLTYEKKATLYGKSVGGKFEWGPTTFKCSSFYIWMLTVPE